MGCYDEFASFNDNLDKGTSGSSEKARLSLYSGSTWSKKTKTSGCFEMHDPRFNMIAFTQPYYTAQFARSNQLDGFFIRDSYSQCLKKYTSRSKKRKKNS